MPLATSMVARQLRPIVAWGNSTGLPEVIGYSWRSDAALRQPSPGPPYSFEATCAFAANIKCPVLIITALDGMYTTSFRLGMKQKWIDNMFAPQTRCVMAIMHGVASARAMARPHAKVRYGLGLAASLALYFGAVMQPEEYRCHNNGGEHLPWDAFVHDRVDALNTAVEFLEDVDLLGRLRHLLGKRRVRGRARVAVGVALGRRPV